MSSPVLKITDGTNTINLLYGETISKKLSGSSGIVLSSWIPSAPSIDSDIWQSGTYTGERNLVHKSESNIVDTFEIMIYGHDQNSAIEKEMDLRRLLDDAIRYWTDIVPRDPVYIVAKGPNEKNERVAIIKDYRIESLDNPYAQPFFGCERSVIQNITLIIEHGIWTEDDSSGGYILPVSSVDRYPYYLEPRLSTFKVQIPHDTLIDDIPSNLFTFEAWVYPMGYGGSGYGVIASKYATNIGWLIRLYNNSYRLEARVECSTTDAYTRTSSQLIANQWNHVAMTYNNSTTRTIRIWINGTEASYTNQVAASGTYNSDNAQNLIIGNLSSLGNVWQGYIGWTKLSSAIMYSSNFTPQPRCRVRAFSSTTRGLWIYEGYGNTTKNLVDGTGNTDGTISAGTWLTDCEIGTKKEYATDAYNSTAYFTHFNKIQQLIYAFYYDASSGTYSQNLIGTQSPVALLPSPVGVGDILYLGWRDYSNNVLFNITTPISGGTVSGVWEMYSYGWISLSVDNDINFYQSGEQYFLFSEFNSTTGVGNKETTVDGKTAVFIRYRVTGVSGSPTPPYQDNEKYLHSVHHMYIDIENDDTTNPIYDRAFGRFDFKYIASSSTYDRLWGGDVDLVDIEVKRIVAGIRSLSRGKNFTADLSLKQDNLPEGITVTYGSTISLTKVALCGIDYSVPYSDLWFTPTDEYSLAARITIDDDIANEYHGVFSVYLRLNFACGTYWADIPIRLKYSRGSEDNILWQRDIMLNKAWWGVYGPMRLYHIGTLNTHDKLSGSGITQGNMYFTLEYMPAGSLPLGTIGLYLYDIILIPTDEWYADIRLPIYQKEGVVSIDSISNPYKRANSVLYSKSYGVSYNMVHGSPYIFEYKNTPQRMWILPVTSYDDWYKSWTSLQHFFGIASARKLNYYKTFRGTR